jgi:predicted ATPase
MISRIYIDNFRCFVNFECQLGPLVLLLGENGTGKTTVLDVLATLREVITAGAPTIQAFPTHTLCAWERRSEQIFELTLAQNNAQYQYRLVIQHDPAKKGNRIKSEEVRVEQRLLYEFDGADARLFRDDGSPGTVFPFDSTRSAISTIPERSDHQQLSAFRKRMERVDVFSPDPLRMVAHSSGELGKADRGLHDVASWLRHLPAGTRGGIGPGAEVRIRTGR